MRPRITDKSSLDTNEVFQHNLEAVHAVNCMVVPHSATHTLYGLQSHCDHCCRQHLGCKPWQASSQSLPKSCAGRLHHHRHVPNSPFTSTCGWREERGGGRKGGKKGVANKLCIRAPSVAAGQGLAPAARHSQVPEKSSVPT